MRPDRFLSHLATVASAIPGVTRTEPVADGGRGKRPYLLEVEAAGKTTRWQVVAVSAPGDRYDQEEREPVLGAVPAAPVSALAAVGSPEQIEAAFISALLTADPGEIASVDAFSLRATAGAVAHGAAFTFHDGSKVFLNYTR
jgi:hypothetical protein